jgi:hypothetical protein
VRLVTPYPSCPRNAGIHDFAVTPTSERWLGVYNNQQAQRHALHRRHSRLREACLGASFGSVGWLHQVICPETPRLRGTPRRHPVSDRPRESNETLASCMEGAADPVGRPGLGRLVRSDSVITPLPLPSCPRMPRTPSLPRRAPHPAVMPANAGIDDCADETRLGGRMSNKPNGALCEDRELAASRNRPGWSGVSRQSAISRFELPRIGN